MSADAVQAVVQPEQLTDTLRRSGALGDAGVASVTVESTKDTILSQITGLRLTYAGKTDAPAALILKTSRPARAVAGWSGGRKEVVFYTEIAPLMSHRLFPRCFGADWNETTGAWHLLLEDLSDTHVIPTVWPLPPTLEQCGRIMDARARFHAAWWDDRRLGTTVGTWGDAKSADQFLQSCAEHLAHVADRFSDAMPPERRDLYERLLATAPRLIGRYRTRRNLTIGHGDAHVWNCFLPRDGGADVRLFDWDDWRINTATADLAYMMAIHWYPDRRQRIERALLDRYHATLTEAGVTGYDREALANDYRLSVLWQMLTPIWQAAHDIPPVIWWNNMERILLAVDDLNCRDLLA